MNRKEEKMAEEIKKKRGRPSKKEEVKIDVNEKSKQITMTQNIQSQNQKSSEIISLEAVQQRWKSVFSKYSTLGFDSIANAWNSSYSALNNPFIQNSRIKQINSKAYKLTKEELQQAMTNPENSENTLCSVSMHLYYTNYIYYNLVQLNRNTPKYNWYALPQYVEKKDYDSDSFKKESQKVDRIIKNFNPNLTFKTIATQVALQGKCSYLPRLSYDNKDVDFFVMQKLNNDMIKLTGFGSKQQFVTSFNMMIFMQPGYNINQYPEYIQDTWNNMIESNIITTDKKGKKKFNPKAEIPNNCTLEFNGENYMYWVRLPQDLCWTFYSDGAHPMSFPDTIGMFSDLNDLGDYKWLQANLLSKGINSVLTAQVPMTKDPKPGSDATAISPDTILGYQDFFASNISGNIFPFFAPFENFELHTLENQPESMDIIFNRTRDLIATSGNSALMTITDKPSIASVKAAEALQASKNDYLTRQFESFLDQFVNQFFELKHKWKFYIWGDVFFWRDDAKMTKELFLTGMKGLLPRLLSSEGYTLEDYRSATLYVESLGINIESNEQKIQEKSIDNQVKLNKMKIESDANKSTTSSKNSVGRPKLSDTDIENDNTGTSADMGNNVSDIKEYSSKNFSYKNRCVICGAELDYEENNICDECLETLYEERIYSLRDDAVKAMNKNMSDEK